VTVVSVTRFRDLSSLSFYVKYTERNKEDGGMFKRTVGAEIVFCEAIDAWVFRHEDISISRNDDDERDNECAWLLYSDETNSFDIIELADENEWLVWTGQIQSDYKVSIVCNECHDKIDCNFHGKCENKKCECSSDRFGIHCQFLRPCKVMRCKSSQGIDVSIFLASLKIILPKHCYSIFFS